MTKEQLKEKAHKEYLAIQKPAEKEYEAIIEPLWKKYQAIIEPVLKKYQAKCRVIDEQGEDTKIIDGKKYKLID